MKLDGEMEAMLMMDNGSESLNPIDCTVDIIRHNTADDAVAPEVYPCERADHDDGAPDAQECRKVTEMTQREQDVE